MGLTQLSAQWPDTLPSGTKSITFVVEWNIFTPVFCDGQQVDYLQGTAIAHCQWHFKNGNYVGATVNSHGTATGMYGEEFKIQEKDKEIEAKGINPWHINLIGNMGHHYIGDITWDFVNDPNMENLIIGKALCLEKKVK
jgi:hypothetical protein